MSTNRTSQAVEFLLNQRSSSPEAGVMMAKKETFRAIAEKYRNMEQALHMIAFQENKLPDDEIVSGMESIAMDALAFDPLTPEPHGTC